VGQVLLRQEAQLAQARSIQRGDHHRPVELLLAAHQAFHQVLQCIVYRFQERHAPEQIVTDLR
jgi:hypothetical protein